MFVFVTLAFELIHCLFFEIFELSQLHSQILFVFLQVFVFAMKPFQFFLNVVHKLLQFGYLLRLLVLQGAELFLKILLLLELTLPSQLPRLDFFFVLLFYLLLLLSSELPFFQFAFEFSVVLK